MMNQNKLEELLGLFVEGEIRRIEYDRLLEYIRSNPEDEDLNRAIDHVFSEIKSYNTPVEEED